MVGKRKAENPSKAPGNTPAAAADDGSVIEVAPSPSATRIKARTTLKQRGVITIPAEVRKATRMEVGDPIDVEITDEGILVRPMKVIDASQAWFWTPEWQAKEREADEEIAAGL